MEPEDIVQDVLLEALEGGFDDRDIPESKLMFFLQGVLANRIRHFWRDVYRCRERRVSSELELESTARSVADPNASWNVALRIELRSSLAQALWRLQKGLRRPLVWYYLQGRSVVEIALLEEVSRDAIWQRLCRARRALHRELNRTGGSGRTEP